MVQVGRIKLELTVGEEGALVISLVRQATGSSQSVARKLIDGGKVYLDGRPCSDWRTPVAAGARLSVDTDRKALRRLPRLEAERILFLDDHVMVVNKPGGLVSTPPTRTGEPTLLELLADLLATRAQAPRPLPLHRLDRESAGLMLFGIAGGQVAKLRRMMTTHQVRRDYYAVVTGRPPTGLLAGTIDVTRRRFGGAPESRTARTQVELVRQAGSFSLLRCRPETGRFHQIRIQLAQAGAPIVGDREHGADSRSDGRMALQSYAVAFAHPATGRQMSFEIPLEPWMAALVEAAKGR